MVVVLPWNRGVAPAGATPRFHGGGDREVIEELR